MEHGICSLREIEKLCRNDIRYMYLLDGMKAPAFATFGNIIRNELAESIEQIFLDVNQYIFEKISLLIDAMNQEVLGYLGLKLEKREEYAIDYVNELLAF